MERNYTAIFLFFTKISLLFWFSGNQFLVAATETSPIDPCVGSDQSNSSNRIALVEARSWEQEKEITSLKNIVAEDRNIINQLKGRVAKLEASSSAADRSATSDNFFGRPKRPARLLPSVILRGKDKNITEIENADTRFYGPPLSCSELAKLGYTLNGYYLVNNGIEEPNKMKFEVVDCRFKQSAFGRNLKMEERLGFVKLDSSLSKLKKKVFDRVSHLKNLKQETCLMLSQPDPETTSNDHMTRPIILTHTTCENRLKGQHWIFKNGTHICLYDGRDCLTVTANGSLVVDYYLAASSQQQWTFDDEENKLVNVDSDLCLSFGGTDRPTNGRLSIVKVTRCDKQDKEQKWYFEPLLVNKDTNLNNAKNSLKRRQK